MSSTTLEPDLLQMTLEASARDLQTVSAAGQSTAKLLDGVLMHRTKTLVDDRGSLVEMIDPRWEEVTQPLSYAYSWTVRPGHAKGWALHREHDDRYFIISGEVEVVLFDVRPESPTYGLVSVTPMSQYDRMLLTIPRFLWHATRNLGSTEAIFVNFPTKPYDHANPEKYRLPLNTPLIPYSFGDTPGW